MVSEIDELKEVRRRKVKRSIAWVRYREKGPTRLVDQESRDLLNVNVAQAHAIWALERGNGSTRKHLCVLLR